ncbi:MAG: hypothetical protein SWK76_17755 [Actinomycetota bacterium]|nr:hypothetical protein [Actinomycetota bacterium]
MVVEGDDDRVLRDMGIDGNVLHMPWDSRDSMSILLDDGSAFVGDLAMNFLGFTGIRHRPIYIHDPGEIHEGWDKILERGARCIYPARGKLFPAGELGDAGSSHYGGT